MMSKIYGNTILTALMSCLLHHCRWGVTSAFVRQNEMSTRLEHSLIQKRQPQLCVEDLTNRFLRHIYNRFESWLHKRSRLAFTIGARDCRR
ncbi:uncharacterized protein B0J16DRAFT_326483 [Fusarium flagelliforme]|uniref:uncharacterized protein n=1 Tax=Fusarium flagelliforme TaxID=2675880 RepID=UPI001E8E5788|nr:uncharacterized protein B0J16DRAFT_326483 [Fusarium flagelliforme]KAH7196717.1 hypothetical protein B0J16DRAFT_326483 [Fusarium flagelliforme]